MKYIGIILIWISLSCNSVVSQQTNEEMQKEKEFDELIKKSKEIQVQNQLAISAADEQTKETVKQAAEKIVDLKEEVKELKIEINEVNEKLESISDTNRVVKFQLRPIPDGKENW